MSRVLVLTKFYQSRLYGMIGRKSKMSLRNKRTLCASGRRFKALFDMAQNHPNPLIVSAATYEPPPAHHFLRRPRNVLSDPPDALTSEVEKLAEAKACN
ncbi:hypothetical protein EVAR_23939_1 [Eumeta japonica]|uniref:Uncharacterized protein n=1 Tax=Eumeta variegata TaxID=151549 RepID=A0A4C1V165_EUMVA|nr:hypothetical protein EVAR_23939_1 [Eumeta japonica]